LIVRKEKDVLFRKKEWAQTCGRSFHGIIKPQLEEEEKEEFEKKVWRPVQKLTFVIS
jgi:HKD family nuclease